MTHANTARRGGPSRRWLTATAAAFLALALFLCLAPPAVSADGDGEGAEASPWRVARLRVTEGTVHVLPDGGEEWDEAEGNVPLSEGDRVSVPGDAAAVLSFRGHEATLQGGADLSVVYLRDERAAYRLSDGRASFRLSDYDFVPVRVSLPSGGRVRMVAPGRYRILVGEDDDAVVRVLRGEAIVSDSEGGKVRIREGQQAYVSDGVRVSRSDEAPPPEEPPAPLTAEERGVQAPPTVVYELRDYGDWVLVGDYGWVWRPRVAVGWSPYVYGGWSWSVSLGWSWVSYEPWGWYPYHCGRWYQDRRYGWCWTPAGAFAPVPRPYPGATTWYRPVSYYPATVRVVREGSNVRWVPLAPRERYVRPVLRREDTAAYRYARPLPPETVYTRDWGRGGGRSNESWRGVAPPRGRAVQPPRDGRPVWRLGDEGAPYRGDRVAPARGSSSRGAEGRPAAPRRDEAGRRVRERRLPEAAPAPGRRGPDRHVPAPSDRNKGEVKAPAAPPRGAAPPSPAPPPPGRGPKEVRPGVSPAAPPAAPPPGRGPKEVRPVAPSAPPQAAPSPGRGLRDVRPVAPPPPRAEGRPAAPPQGRGEGRGGDHSR